ncbi:anti-sigma factor [Parerythrobacter aestuarii]|uniref:anti-sigma factor n=1 Tax=Parerythrobacter aestuarii TaxID=3020909 RepID=UPI0024DE880F|nr:anti-sigma factor [Parerythrobacter aestuarii]
MTEHDHLAAEYALGLLEGEELLRARGMEARDADFAATVAKWQAHFAPLLDEVPAQEPRTDLWQSIEAELDRSSETGGNVVAFENRLRRWKWATGLSSAVAACLLLMLTFFPYQTPTPVAPEAGPPLAASIPVGETGLRLEVTYLDDRHELLVSAAGLTADGVHDHELWVVPEEGAPQSLGVVAPGKVRKTSLDDALAAQLRDGAELVLTREPLGGAPKDGEAGPVVAQGTFTAL